MAQRPQQNAGLTLAGILGIAFIVLKLVEKIDWSWWWVLSPFWIPPCIYIVSVIAVEIIKALRD